MAPTEETMEAERTAFEQRQQLLTEIENKEERLEELEKDEKSWKEKYRRRMKTFNSTSRVPEYTADFLETLEMIFEDFRQAHEFLQDTLSHILKVKNETQQNVEEVTKNKREKAEDFDRCHHFYQNLEDEILRIMRQTRLEAQEAEARRRREEEEAEYRRKRLEDETRLEEQAAEYRRKKIEDEANITREQQAQAQARAQAPMVPDRQHERRELNPVSKLKKVDLPTFDGKPQNYLRWKSTFDVLVKDNNSIDKNSKYLYLQQALTGEALKIMEHLEHSPASYDMAVKLLEERYGGEKRQIQFMYNRIKDIKPVRDFLTLQEYLYSLLGIVSTMETYRMNKDDQIICIQLCEKMNQRYMREYLQYLEKNEKSQTIDTLVEYVKKELEISQAAYEATNNKYKFNSSGEKVKKSVNGVSKSKPEADKRKEKKCNDCQGDHAIWQCPVFKQKSLDGRLQVVREKGLCFKCLGKGHTKLDCQYKGDCSQNDCKGGHHPLLHRKNNYISTNKSSTHEETHHIPEESSEVNHVGALNSDGKENRRHKQKTVLNIVPVYVFRNNGSKKIKVLALLDSGSSTTFISEGLKRKLGLHGKKEVHIFHQPLQEHTIKRAVEVIDCVKLESESGEFSVDMKNVETMPGSLQADAVNWEEYKETYPYLKDIKFPYISHSEKADILIGSDQTILFQKLDQKVPSKNGDPIAIETPLGWVCMGLIPTYRTNRDTESVYHCVREDEDEVNQLLKKFWEVDSVNNTHREMSIEDREVLEKTRQSTVYDGAQYTVAIPFNSKKIENPSQQFKEDMWKMASKRLQSTENSLRKVPGRRKSYQDILDSYIERGYARIVDDPENTKWLLPHFPVIKEERETTQMRVVLDGAAKVQNISLNDQIIEGPKLQRDIFEVLLRFRRYEIALNSDIKEMFLGIKVPPEDSKFLRLLWKEKETDRPHVIELTRVVFGVNASPFLANCTLLDHAEKYREIYPQAIETLTRSTYVDDTLDSVKTVNEAITLYQQITEVCNKAGWKVHKWSSNNQEFLKAIPKEDKAKGQQEDTIAQGLSVKTLGMKWKPETDIFEGEAVTVDLECTKVTKRVVLKKLAKIYDPLGIMSPYVIQCKILLQEIWMAGLDWDEELDDKLYNKVMEWFEDLPNAEHITHSRALFVSPHTIQEAQLHCFTDASEKAYGIVIYLRLVYPNEVKTKWVAAKGRVCPIEPISIPRLELIAAVLGAQMVDKVKNALGYQNLAVRMWTDSMTTLWWIKGRTRNLKLFVANRVLEILKYTEPHQWKHVPGEQNPADIISRGSSLQELKKNNLWKYGPEFLVKQIEDWPIQNSIKTSAAEREVKKNFQEKIIGHLNLQYEYDNMSQNTEEDAYLTDESSQEEESDEESEILSLMKKRDHIQQNKQHQQDSHTLCGHVRMLIVDPKVDDYMAPSRFSKLDKLVRVRAYVKRFLHNSSVNKEERTTGCLKVWEILEAETEIIVHEQKQAFKTEYKDLLTNGILKNVNSKLIDLNPKLDQDGVIRVDGRIRDHPNMPWTMQCPIILPKNSPVTDLIIRREHEKNHMLGTNYLMGRLKEKYWILSARSQIKSQTQRCMRCKLLKHKVMTQQMGLLPASRTQVSMKAFENVGVDMAGPIMIKIGRGKPQQKRWICLFTCLATRAVHLELCSAIDLDCFMNALARFIGRRGVPVSITSDNGTNFHGADNEMKKLFEIFESKECQERCNQKRIVWKFNPPGGPHHGGVFEAMIKAAKTALKDVLHKQDLTEEELYTALVSIEGMMNQRPLSYVGADKEEFVLTPNHFLHGSMGGMLAPEVVDGTPTFQRKWRAIQQLMKEIWSRWLREWVAELNKRKKWQQVHENLKVGDVVMVIEENIFNSRGDFPLGRILEVHMGPDDLVRSAKVKLSDGRVNTKTIQKLVKIESS